jgi:hypothetical protein
MSFSFGAPAAAAAPAGGGGGFSFGSASTAPATNTAATAPAGGGGFSFGGSAPAPAAPGAFGSSPAPAAPGGFGFGVGGAAPAPSGFGGAAPAQSGFGAAPTQSAFGAAPAQSAFGAAPAPAQAGFGGFGGAAPAPVGFGSPPPQQQYQQQQQQHQQQPQAAPFAGSTPYAALPPEYQKAIDGLHERMMQHKRSMNNVQSMAPQALLSANGSVGNRHQGGPNTQNQSQQNTPPKPQPKPPSPSPPSIIQTQIASLDRGVVSLQQDLQNLHGRATTEKTACESQTQQAYLYGKWPVEAVAVRRGVRLESHQGGGGGGGGEEKKDPDTQTRVRELLDQQLAYVDRVERMPSPYLWQIMDDMKHRLTGLQQQATTLDRQLDQSRAMEITNAGDVVSIVETQCRAIWQVRNQITHVQREMEVLRHKYRMYERDENVLEKAQREERERQRRVDDQIQSMYVQASSQGRAGGAGGGQAGQPQQPGQLAAAGFGAAPPAAGGLFGSAPAPVAGGLFGSAPAPAAGGLFGSAPAPAAGGLFGSSPAAAAPAPAGLFGAAPAAGAAAAAPSAFAFGGTAGASTFSSTPKKKSGSRSSARLKR